MAIQVITAKIQVDTTDLEAAKVEVSELEKELGMAEGSAEKITKEFSKQAKAVDELTKEEKRLIKERNKSTDPRQIRKLNKEIERTRRDVKKLSGDFRQAGRSGKKSFGLLQNAARTLGPAIAAAFSVSLIKDFVVATIDAAAKFEQTQVAFTTLLGGSSEAANKLIGDLERLSLATPLTPESLNEAARTLLSFGIAQDKILPTLQRLGDVAQGDSQKLQQLSLVFGQISSAGRLMGQDLLQLINVGFNPLQVISEQTGRSVSDLKKDMEKGLITFDKVEEAFKSATEEGGLFFGAMEAQSTTFSGRVSTLEGNVDALKRQIGEQLLPIAGQFVELLLEMTKNADRLGEEFSVLSALMDGITGLLKILTEQEKENAIATEALHTVIKNILFPIQAAVDAFQDLERDLKKVAAAMDEVFASVNDLFGLDIATPFKDAADATRALEERQRENANTTARMAAVLAHFQNVTGATDQEVAAFRGTLGNLSTEGKTANQVFDEVVSRFEAWKLAQDRSTESTAKTKEAVKGLRKELEVLGTETLDGFGAAAEVAAAFSPLDELPERIGLAYDEWLMMASETAGEITNLNRDSVAEDVAMFRDAQQEKIAIAGQFLDAIFNMRAASIQRESSQRVAELNQRREQQLANESLTAKEREAININYDAQVEKIEKEAFERQKRFARAQAVINGALAVTKILAEVPKGDFGIATAFLIAGAIATTAAQISAIDAQQFATGVIDLDGPGTGTSDDIPAWLSRGESVITAQKTKAFLPTLKGIHDGSLSPDLMNSIALNGITNDAISNIGASSMVINGNFDPLRGELKEVANILRRIDKKPQIVFRGKEFERAIQKKLGKNTYINRGI